MSNRLFQGVIQQVKESINTTIGVIDDTGLVLVCSNPMKVGEVVDSSAMVAFKNEQAVVVGNYTFKSFTTPQMSSYAVFIEGTDAVASKFADIVAICLSNIKQYHDEKFDRSNFVKNVILENVLPGDIHIKARELRLGNGAFRVVLLVRLLTNTEVPAFDVIQSLFPDRNKDFVIGINETDIAIVKEVGVGADTAVIEDLAKSISETLASEEYGVETLVGIGTTVTGIRDLSRSFKESQIALEVGKVFDQEKSIMAYEHLGIARLIYQLPITLCEMFLRDVFKAGSVDSLDQETIFTIRKFFENNLNVSETARKLFVHRNTLVYRLEKIKKLTGLDLREFDDAIVFKVALMVKKYLNSNPMKY